SFAHTFTEPGTYQYYCEYHAPRPQANGSRAGLMSPSRTVLRGGGGHMIGMITVTAAAQGARSGEAQAADTSPVEPDNKLANVVAAEAPAQGAAEAGQGLPATGGSGTPALLLLAAMVLAAGVGLALRRRASIDGR
ncbi:MAG TPA: LPXTG cell wall anchor domain-containing protein, partial [Herpetosiphonaceae bacterium]|nr:LPXTG cell wall anchor domain-containing protein [Herpetosiphonaceae bacterium]